MAKEQLFLGNYELAAIYFERVAVFDSSQEFPEARAAMADCYFAAGNYSLAAEQYGKAFFLVNESLKSNELTTNINAQFSQLQNDLVLKKVLCHLLEKENQQALLEIYMLPEPADSLAGVRKKLYQGIAHFSLEEFEQSKAQFATLRPSDELFQSELDRLFIKNKKLNRLNPQVAMYMSMVIPGSGQIYAGDFRNGINSMAITGLLGYLFLSTAEVSGILESFFFIFPWLQRYYQGGRKAAFKIATDKKAQNRAGVYREIMLLME
ncbi:hypothetical protein N8482_00440 [Chitinophagales bacterium]|nr:hypothetical protein [Chitinophagales bacterium]